MATNLVAKMGQNYLPPALIALSFRNGMGYRLANMRINSSTNCSTSCEKMVKIGSVFFELKWGRKWKLSCKSAKIGLYCQISQVRNNYWTSLYQCFSVCRCIYADYKTDISFAVVQGKQLILGDFCRRQNWRLRSLLSRSETKCTIVLQMHALIAPLIALHRVKKLWKSVL